jgi:threonine dehydrogenase-like Zn-dependent dehydrogenase
MQQVPIGKAVNKNLTIQMGNCNHRRYIPMLADLVASGTVDPRVVLSHEAALTTAIEAYAAFGLRKTGWIKVELDPTS